MEVPTYSRMVPRDSISKEPNSSEGDFSMCTLITTKVLFPGSTIESPIQIFLSILTFNFPGALVEN